MSRHEPKSKAARDIYFGLRDYEPAADEPTPLDEDVKHPCRFCGKKLPGFKGHACGNCTTENQR